MIKTNISAVILAAGNGNRLGGANKALLTIGDKTFLQQAINLFDGEVDEIIVTYLDDHEPQYLGVETKVKFVKGGETRQESFANALRLVKGETVVVHDVARPLVTKTLLKKIIQASKSNLAVCLAGKIKARDSLAYVDGGYIGNSINRENLFSIQTPQSYDVKMLLAVFQQAKSESWFEQSLVPLVKRANIDVYTVINNSENIKATYPEDIKLINKIWLQNEQY
jgi:2-C-methyl-D-erythritol 4-phosphate cytidylyltransferase